MAAVVATVVLAVYGGVVLLVARILGLNGRLEQRLPIPRQRGPR